MRDWIIPIIITLLIGTIAVSYGIRKGISQVEKDTTVVRNK